MGCPPLSPEAATALSHEFQELVANALADLSEHGPVEDGDKALALLDTLVQNSSYIDDQIVVDAKGCLDARKST